MLGDGPQGDGMSISSLAIWPDLSPGWPLEKERAHTATCEDALQHIFVIAGPSGSGKSTFMREFVEDRLPQNVADDLPVEAKIWSRTSGNELTRKGLFQGFCAPRADARGLCSTTTSCALTRGGLRPTPTTQPCRPSRRPGQGSR